MTILKHSSGSYYADDDPGEACYKTRAPRLSVTDTEAELLSQLAHGRCVLEIGTGLGVSTRALAKRSAYLYTIDNDPWVQREIWPDLMREQLVATFASLEDYEDARVAGELPTVPNLVFIDGDHAQLAVARDLLFACRVASDNALFVLHDVGYPDVRKAVETVGGMAPLLVLPTEHGVGITWRRP